MTINDQRFSFPVLEVAGLLMILLSIGLLVIHLGQYSDQRQDIPQGLVLGEVPVGNLSRSEARTYLEQVYGAPVIVTYEGQEIMLDPREAGFVVNSQSMLSQADELRTEGTFWPGFWDYLWNRSEQTYEIELQATYSEARVLDWLDEVAARYDQPPQPSTIRLSTLSVVAGEAGYTLDKEASLAGIEAALMSPTDRRAELVIDRQTAPDPGMETLEELLTEYLLAQNFRGVASIHVIDLQNGEELDMEKQFTDAGAADTGCTVAYAGMSTMKIPIMVEYFNFLQRLPITSVELDDSYKILYETMVQSGNISANFMIQSVGYGNILTGSRTISDSMKYLGLENTFMAAPYDWEEDPEYYTTPAREAARNGDCIDTQADIYMQTTTEDLATLLDLIYQCAEFGGGLVAAYPDGITQRDCRMMIDLMQQNFDGPQIRSGLPEGTMLAHKHGWISDTQGDAGIVFSEGGDYVLVMLYWSEGQWQGTQLFPINQDISAAVFNYFNPDQINTPRFGIPDDLFAPEPEGE